MKTQFALDLCLARRKAGYTQRDVAHLLGTRKSVVSDLEQGRRRPRLTEIVTLSVLYGRSFESLFAEVMALAETALRRRVLAMPKPPRRSVRNSNREGSIERLARRLADNEISHDDI